MEDNKEKQNDQAGTPANGQTGPQPADFGSAGVDDINKNVGQFTTTVNGPAAQPTSELKLDVDKDVVDKASKEKIDFERFDKTKKEKKHSDPNKPNTHFGEKVSMMLRSKKGLRTTWILEMVIMAVVIIISACLIAWLKPHLSDNRIVIICGGVTKAGYIFLWISLFPCLIPLIYLLTTWFIGINQVASSKMYHVFFWITAAVSIVCLIMGICLCAKAMDLIAHMGKTTLACITSIL